MMHFPDSFQARRFCPVVTCPDNFVQDPNSCQCMPVAQNLDPSFVQSSRITHNYINELCANIPQLMKEDVCPEYYKRIKS